MASERNEIFTRLQEAGGRLRVRSALNPILWLCAIVSMPSLAMLLRFGNPPMWLVVLICTPVASAVFGFIFLLFFDRDKLQSEDYQIRKRQLELIEQKGDMSPMLVQPDSLKAVPRPGSSNHGDDVEGSP